MCGGHWSNASGGIKNLIFHVTSQNYMIEGSCNVMSGRVGTPPGMSPPCQVWWP